VRGEKTSLPASKIEAGAGRRSIGIKWERNQVISTGNVKKSYRPAKSDRTTAEGGRRSKIAFAGDKGGRKSSEDRDSGTGTRIQHPDVGRTRLLKLREAFHRQQSGWRNLENWILERNSGIDRFVFRKPWEGPPWRESFRGRGRRIEGTAPIESRTENGLCCKRSQESRGGSFETNKGRGSLEGRKARVVGDIMGAQGGLAIQVEKNLEKRVVKGLKDSKEHR